MVVDNRLANTTRHYWNQPEDWGMRIPEDLRKCVVFCARAIAKGSQTDPYFRGTGFVVSVPSVGRPHDRKFLYLVTARHVMEPLCLGDWLIRMNTKEGRFVDEFHGKTEKWWFHPSEPDLVDVAVMPWGPTDSPGCTPDVRSIPVGMFLDDDTIKRVNIGAGDEVFMTGLFTNEMTGKARNLPIVRTGNVALIPDAGELVPGMKIGGRHVEAEAYLIEARSIGGISGSPAFVRATGTLQLPSRNNATGEVRTMEWSVPGEYYLLGAIHGHWELLAQDKNETDLTPVKKGDDDVVNMGIAIVTPSKKIREVLYHPELVEQRRQCDQEAIDAMGTTTSD